MSTLANPKFHFSASAAALAGEMRRNSDAGCSGWGKIWLGLGRSSLYAAICLIMVLTLCLSLPGNILVAHRNLIKQAKLAIPGNQIVRKTAQTTPMPVLVYKEHSPMPGYMQSFLKSTAASPALPSVRRLIDLNASYRAAAVKDAEQFTAKELNSEGFDKNFERGLLSLKNGEVRVMAVVPGGTRIPRLLDKKMAGESGELKPALFSEPNVEREESLSLWDDAPFQGEDASGSKDLELASIAEYDFCRRLPSIWSEGLRRMPVLPAEDLPPDGNMLKRSAYYRKYVDYYAVRYGLDASLVMSIMHTESNFNPFAVSRSNALGLMQIVPETAGKDVYAYLTGKRGSPSQATLFEAEYNIQYGITYLHLLNSTHFNQILDTASREMCVVAAYNGGAGAVLRVFDADKEVAFATINSMAPSDVYETLISKMPSPESRRYVETVLGHMKNYN